VPLDAAGSRPLPTAPGLRLPSTVAPAGYRLRLEIDPERPEFRGHVEIAAQLAEPTDHVWLHADQLTITNATYDGGKPLATLPVRGEQMLAFGFAGEHPAGDVTLAFDYVGHTDHDQEGLFRQTADGRVYVYSQGESVFARRIVPCFDEPRFKTPWQVTIVAPSALVVLGNTPAARERMLSDGRREVELAPTPPMPSYLLAVAVGPFDVVDVGALGRARVPVRVATLAGTRDSVRVVAARMPAVVDAIERTLDEPLPWPKLDLVVVPRLFGAMENPGLLTFDEGIVVGDPQDEELARHFTRIAAHELAHLWFGDRVTPAWWDDLWWVEGFASWLGDQVAHDAHGFDDFELRMALSREAALAADDEPDARALHAAIDSNAEPDQRFDALAYDKGEQVVETFFRRAQLRQFADDHRDGTATSDDVIALTPPELRPALRAAVERPGVPVVDLALHCDAKPAVLEAKPRAGVAVPLEIDIGHRVATALVGEASPLAIPIGDCTAPLVPHYDNGYYEVSWTSGAALGPHKLPPGVAPRQAIALGDDVAGGVLRGEVDARAALTALSTLAATGDTYVQLGAVAIARAIDPLVDDPTRVAWAQWLAARFATRLTAGALLSPRTPAATELRDALVALIPASTMPLAVARAVAAEVDRTLARGVVPAPALVAVANPVGADARFERLLTLASATHSDERAEAFAALGQLSTEFVVRAFDAFKASDAPGDLAWPAIAGYLERGATRAAAWRVMRASAAMIRNRLGDADLPLAISAAGGACDTTTRAEVEAAFGPLATTTIARATLARVVAKLERCVARRARLGDLAAALRH
jgi:alanyl aminopeptidase